MRESKDSNLLKPINKSGLRCSYWVSAIYDMAPNPVAGVFVVRTEIAVSSAKITANTYDHLFTSYLDVKHSFTQRTATIGTGVLWNAINKTKFKFFAGLGVRMNFASYDKQRVC
jgi:hypothetical protein